MLKVRSYVQQQKVTRELPRGQQGYGPLRRPKAKKKMTVEMTEPFEWPELPKDLSPYVIMECLFLFHDANRLTVLFLTLIQVGTKTVLRN